MSKPDQPVDPDPAEFFARVHTEVHRLRRRLLEAVLSVPLVVLITVGIARTSWFHRERPVTGVRAEMRAVWAWWSSWTPEGNDVVALCAGMAAVIVALFLATSVDRSHEKTVSVGGTAAQLVRHGTVLVMCLLGSVISWTMLPRSSWGAGETFAAAVTAGSGTILAMLPTLSEQRHVNRQYARWALVRGEERLTSALATTAKDMNSSEPKGRHFGRARRIPWRVLLLVAGVVSIPPAVASGKVFGVWSGAVVGLIAGGSLIAMVAVVWCLIGGLKAQRTRHERLPLLGTADLVFLPLWSVVMIVGIVVIVNHWLAWLWLLEVVVTVGWGMRATRLTSLSRWYLQRELGRVRVGLVPAEESVDRWAPRSIQRGSERSAHAFTAAREWQVGRWTLRYTTRTPAENVAIGGETPAPAANAVAGGAASGGEFRRRREAR